MCFVPALNASNKGVSDQVIICKMIKARMRITNETSQSLVI